MARVGIREVAALAGVSLGTVSNYLNHRDRVSAERAERIRAAIESLGFVPNNAGRQLRLGRGSAIAYLAPDVSNPYFTELAEAVELAAAQRRVSMFIANSHRDRAREDDYLHFFEQNQVLAMLVASHWPIEERLEGLRRRGTPSVLVGQAAMSHEQASISLDDVEGGRLAMAHLIEEGCARVAVVGGPLNITQIGDRLAGASEAIRAAGRTVSLEVIQEDDRTIRGGRTVAELLLSRPPEQRPDGIFAVNDLLALGIMQTLVDSGISIPRDVAIVGYDDIEFGGASLIPLTSIGGRHADFGTAAVDLLFQEIEGRAIKQRHRLFTPELVVRASSRR
ncbi:LacI family DNA-binding transcriptional regulator [Microbacterium tumbae]